MSHKTSLSASLGFLVVCGSVWGLSEAALGLTLESCAKLVSGSIMTGVALFFISAAWTRTKRAAGPALVDDPAPADSSQPGKDTRYGGQALQPQPPAPPPEVPGHEWPGEEPPKKKEPSFIDILLTDEEGNPVPGERYRVTDSDNKVHEGGLDANGKAHVIVPEGECEVTFPNLDDEAWDRTS